MWYVMYKAKSGLETSYVCGTKEEAINFYKEHLYEMVYGYIADKEAEETGIGIEMMEEAAAVQEMMNCPENNLIDWSKIF